MIRTRLHRPLLALALLPAAGGIALASAGGSAGASTPPGQVPTAHVQVVRSASAPIEPGDDSGGHDGRTAAIRAPEVGDDSGGHGGHATTRAPEAGDDSGGHGGHDNSGGHDGHSGHGGSDDGPNHS